MPKSHRRSLLMRSAAAVLVLGVVAGCAKGPSMPDIEAPPTPDRKAEAPRAENLVRFEQEPVVTLEADISQLLDVDYDRGEPIPPHEVGQIMVTEWPVLDLLRTLVEPYGVAVIPGPGLSDVEISLIDPVDDRPLGEAIDMIARHAGLFYHYEDGVLTVDRSRPFSVRVPDIAQVEGLSGDQIDLQARFVETFGALGAQDVSSDGHSGLVSFTANQRAYARIAEYLESFENGRDVIVYDAWVYQVNLNRNKKAGVDWNDFSTSLGEFDLSLDKAPSSALNSVAEGGLSLGVAGKPGKFVLDFIFSFLSTQGDVKALAKPSLSMANGRAASFSVGETLRYIARIEKTETGGDDDDSDDDNVTVQDATLETGVKMNLGGNHNNGVITTRVNLDLVELINFQEFSTGNDEESVTLNLPQTSERKISTEVQARPGDLIIIGGLIQDRGEYGGDDIMMLDVPVSRESVKERRELVIMLRPRLVQIRAKAPDARAPEGDAPTSRPAPDAAPTPLTPSER